MEFKFLENNDERFLVGLPDFWEARFEPEERLILPFVRNNDQQFENSEFCLQFDDEEPFVFAYGHSELNISIRPTGNGEITFTHNGRRFKLFARERQ